MNTLVIVLIAAVCLFGAYMLYGRWLANKWGIDPSAKTPAVVHEDGRDYVPTDGWTVFAHQFSSIAAAVVMRPAVVADAAEKRYFFSVRSKSKGWNRPVSFDRAGLFFR